MELGIAIFVGLFFLLLTDCFTPEKPSRTTEEELGDAIAQYLAKTKKAAAPKDAKK